MASIHGRANRHTIADRSAASSSLWLGLCLAISWGAGACGAGGAPAPVALEGPVPACLVEVAESLGDRGWRVRVEVRPPTGPSVVDSARAAWKEHGVDLLLRVSGPQAHLAGAPQGYRRIRRAIAALPRDASWPCRLSELLERAPGAQRRLRWELATGAAVLLGAGLWLLGRRPSLRTGSRARG